MEVAQVGVPFQAGLTPAARRHKGQNYLVARLGQRYAWAYLLHGPRAFVTQNRRQRNIGVAMHEMSVAAANPGGPDFHQHLAGLGFIQVNVLNHQGLAILVQYGSLHLRASCVNLVLIIPASALRVNRAASGDRRFRRRSAGSGNSQTWQTRACVSARYPMQLTCCTVGFTASKLTPKHQPSK